MPQINAIPFTLMSEELQSNKPYKRLGSKLRSLRTKRQETLMEVSGAVEIDLDQLSSYENGITRPSQEILALLISYFDIKEDESAKLWELAGYANMASESPFMQAGNEEFVQMPQIVVLPMDVRIVYTDLVHVMINNHGVVINFMQGAGPNNQPLAVSRVGMSMEHAKSFLEVLKSTIEKHENPPAPKQLPSNSGDGVSRKNPEK